MTGPDAAAGALPAEPKVFLERNGAVATLVLNRPKKLNALDLESIDLIAQIIDEVNADESIRALVVEGRGRAFSAGADLAAIVPFLQSPEQFDGFLTRWNGAFDAVEACQVPTIAAVAGITFAGGLELTHVCDFVILGDDVTIGDQHANFGMFPAGGGVHRLARLVGLRRAKWLLMSGEALTPQQALEWGLANEVCPTSDVVSRAHERAALLATKSSALNSRIKRELREDATVSVAAAMDAERPHAVAHMTGPDARAGLSAFAQRTTPTFPARVSDPAE